MSAWLTQEDIEAAKAIGRRRKPISDEQKAVLRETFGPLVRARIAAQRDAAGSRRTRRSSAASARRVNAAAQVTIASFQLMYGRAVRDDKERPEGG